ncbi:outer membrane protein assembly factor BamA [Phaeovulum vinaykumarii]|uniref:Outer membrane protein assembly factor BamA n=1 Tax=Phaeovulum vinaykumarii TaxID=407234 RepID=A0A1N7MUI0_9RHOB|nr:outer membrane protein assembly factor BamA [Phaeovulum vinaykumarii]SIS89787.1 Beta-barrel assembly machine subunit BamA [Phaeovulum vinaykumarii]SOC17060.1 Beta-barrel assembly machine subunit BamA [Phaeovulum vinaykumarii]
MTVGGQGSKSRKTPATVSLRSATLSLALAGLVAAPLPALAQNFRFDQVSIEGLERIEPATVLSLAGIARGEQLSGGALNDAYQRLKDSGLFERVELVPQGGRLVIRLAEYPTVSRVAFEGNKRIKDEDLQGIIKIAPRRVFSPSQLEADAQSIADAYAQTGRLAARVDPKVIRRAGNRVDIAFEIREGRVSEVERISFTGNRAYSDSRLRRVLDSKQAGIFRAIISRDTFVPERIEFDRKLLVDFYRARGYIDAEVQGVSSEMARSRDGFFLNFKIHEGQKYALGRITTRSEIEGVPAGDFQAALKIKPGVTYSPLAIDNSISRMEALALQRGINFLRVEPRITRHPETQTLDVEFVLSRGPRVFVERIDIEGNVTTLDRVVRRQFRSVEGDPFNPREIREAADRLRALRYFSNVDVQSRPGSTSDKVIVDVNLEEQPTGSLAFGASYGVNSGFGVNVSLQESNLLGRGQYLGLSIGTSSDDQKNSLTFIEPYFLGRDLKFKFNAYYNTSDDSSGTDFSTRMGGITPSIEFPVSERTRLELRYTLSYDDLVSVNAGSSPILTNEIGALWSSGLGYTVSYDTRKTGLNPDAGVLLQVSQDLLGMGGDVQAVRTTALASAEKRLASRDLLLRAELEAGAIGFMKGNSRVIDRFMNGSKIRGFEPGGIGPRDIGAANQDVLGGNYYAVARFEAEFPLGLPEEYGITGGAFFDVGSIWGLSTTAGGINVQSEDFKPRAAAGVSVFWTTPLGPLRFNFAKALVKEDYDEEQNFDLTISTRF